IAIQDAKHVNIVLAALSEQLAARGEAHAIVVIGGSALIALELVSRATRDVDVLALLKDEKLISAKPLPDGLLEAAKLVADDFGLPERWLNSGPTSLLDLGLPAGFIDRGERRNYGPGLEVLFA